MATPLQGRFVVFLTWLSIGYFRLGYIGLGDCITGLEPPAGAINSRKATVKNTKNRSLWTERCRGKDYTQIISHLYIIFLYIQGGRGHWAVYYTSPQCFLIRLSTLETLIKSLLVGSLS